MAITSINLGKIKFNWKGAWALGVPYVKDDVVRYSGSSYVCVTGHTSATSWATNSSKFELMAEGTTPTTTQGDLIVRGATQDERLGVGDPGQVLTIVSGVPAWADNGVNDKIYYVSPSGDDANSGLSWGTAFATIKHACAQAVGPATVYVASGQYAEQLPIIVPSFVAVVGDNQRTTIVGPAPGYEQQTMWKLGDGALLNKMCFIGLTGFVPYAPDDTNIELATIGGVYIAFDPLVPIATKSPYVIECSAKSSGGVGALVDGSVHLTGIKSMVFHGYTVIMDNGVGFWVKDNGKSEIVSCFTYYCHMGYVTTGGGKIRALNGNNSYGTYGSLSKGYNLGEATVNGTIYGNMLTWQNGTLAGGSFSDGETITGGTSGATGVVQNVQPGTSRIYYKSSNAFTFQAGETISNGSGVSATIATGGVTGQTGVILVVTGLSSEPKPGGSIEITGDTYTYVIQSSSGWSNSGSKVVIVLAGEKSAISTDGTSMKIRYDYSQVRLTGHDFLNIGTGGVVTTNYPGVPVQAPTQGNEVIEQFPGRVFYVSTDQDGNFRVGEYFKVDQATGRATLNASAFDLSGLTSLRLGSIGAQLGEQINEFSSDTTLSGNSNLAVPTEKAIRTYFGQIATNVAPSISNSLTLGTSSYLWDKVYANKLIGPSTLTLDPAAEGDNTGTVVIKGNLQVDGTTTTINSTTLIVDDKNIVLADGATLDSQADGAGISVSGATTKTFNWVDATDAWTSSEHLDLASGKSYYINGTAVVNATSLGSGVVSSSLTSVGTLSSLTVSGTINANGTTGIVTSQTGTVPLFNTNATGLNIGGAATAISIGAGTGTTTINNPTVTLGAATTVNVNGASPTIATSSTGTVTLFNTNATTVNAFGAASTIAIGATGGTLTVNNTTVTFGSATTFNINGASPTVATSSTGTASVFNTNALTGNLFGAATTINAGAQNSSSTFNIYNKLSIRGSTSGSVTFQAPATAGSVTYTLPSADAAVSGYALVSNGAGTLSWAAAGATIADDTSTTALYPVFSTATSGSLTSAKVSSTKFSFNASTGKGTITALIVGDNTTSSGALVVGSANSYAGGLVLGKPSTYSGYISATDNLYVRPYASGGAGSGNMVVENASGTAQFTMNCSTGAFTAAGTLTSNSDARLKTNVETITSALNKVLSLRGVMYDRISSGKREVGMIAQEVEEIIPELVVTDENGIKSLAYANTVAMLVEAIKEQQTQIDELKKKLA